MESKVKKIVKDAFHTEEFEILSRLMGGRSNYTYVIVVDENKYTLRIPGKNGNLFVNREYEQANLRDVNKLKINNETVYLDLKSGVKISRFIEGESLFNFEYDKYYEQVSKILHTVHNMHRMENNYNPMGRLSMYESFCIDLGFSHSNQYYELKDRFVSYLEFLKNDELVACHNDAQPSNFIVGNDGKLYLTDWEFAGNNYALYDIACFADGNIDAAIKLLEVYKINPDVDDYKRVYLWRMFQTLQWHNVAMYKELIGLSQELLVDFYKVANDYLITAEKLLEKVIECDENK
ncbi:MAG: phosphotransferase [Bacilli bacterium]